MYKFTFPLLLTLFLIACQSDNVRLNKEINVEWLQNLKPDEFKTLILAHRERNPSLFKPGNSKFCITCFDWDTFFELMDYCDAFGNPDGYPINSPEYQSFMTDCMLGSQN